MGDVGAAGAKGAVGAAGAMGATGAMGVTGAGGRCWSCGSYGSCRSCGSYGAAGGTAQHVASLYFIMNYFIILHVECLGPRGLLSNLVCATTKSAMYMPECRTLRRVGKIA